MVTGLGSFEPWQDYHISGELSLEYSQWWKMESHGDRKRKRMAGHGMAHRNPVLIHLAVLHAYVNHALTSTWKLQRSMLTCQLALLLSRLALPVCIPFLLKLEEDWCWWRSIAAPRLLSPPPGSSLVVLVCWSWSVGFCFPGVALQYLLPRPSMMSHTCSIVNLACCRIF